MQTHGCHPSRPIRVMLIMGTRPECIKCFPVIRALKADPDFDVRIVFTGQHRELLTMMIEDLGLADFTNLEIFSEGQSLSDITALSLARLETLGDVECDYCIVQGDTTTVFAGALWGFYRGMDIVHLEAGLRSGNLKSPFPEEANRRLTGVLTSIHLAPTERARENLLAEGIAAASIHVVGNTVIDALRLSVKDDYRYQNPVLAQGISGRKVLLTCHRRENRERMEEIFSVVRDVADDCDLDVIFPMHPTPFIRETAKRVFGDSPRMHLIDPVVYHDMVHLLRDVEFVVTDSGGLQEEAPGFGKPVLVIREETERPEGIEAGTCRLAGTRRDTLEPLMRALAKKGELYASMAHAANPYGDGHAAEAIRDILREHFVEKERR